MVAAATLLLYPLLEELKSNLNLKPWANDSMLVPRCLNLKARAAGFSPEKNKTNIPKNKLLWENRRGKGEGIFCFSYLKTSEIHYVPGCGKPYLQFTVDFYTDPLVVCSKVDKHRSTKDSICKTTNQPVIVIFFDRNLRHMPHRSSPESYRIVESSSYSRSPFRPPYQRNHNFSATCGLLEFIVILPNAISIT
jgi:hypothetical protein